MSTETRLKTKYIYDLPYSEREELCHVLDIHEKWKTLGGHMRFNTLEIQALEHLERRGKSPSDELLTKWSLQNHTVQELFVLLAHMRHFQAMVILKPFVDSEYHKLMYEGEESLTRILANSGAALLPQSLVNSAGAVQGGAAAAAAATSGEKSFGGHNLNVMLPEAVKSNKSGFSDTDKIQNIRSPVSLEENIPNQVVQLSSSRSFRTPGTAQFPPVQAASTMNKAGGLLDQIQLSPAGIAALSAGSPAAGKSSSIAQDPHHMDLPVATSQQRKLSDGSMATMHSEYHSVIPMHDYKEMEAATNGWSTSNILGRGGFGTVFKGDWKNTDVAIKRIELPKGESRETQEIPYQQSQRELQVLQKIHHKNILQLYSFSFNGNQPCLVYQFMENGSLEDRLQCRNRTAPLTWPQRYNIAKGTARGLQYLHTVQDKPLIHGDIKSANILLDSNFEPRIGDFGLAREGPQIRYTHMTVSRVHGTRPYLPDEFLRSKKLSTKVDTYSFGVVLFELATGLRAYDDKRINKYLREEVLTHKDVIQLMDAKAGKAPVMFGILIELGKQCVSKLPKDRPEMTDVWKQLDKHPIASAQVTSPTPLELQVYYDQLGQQRRQSIGNGAQGTPGSSQPANSNSRTPANFSFHPLNGQNITKPPSPGTSGNAPASLGIVYADHSANGQFIPIGQLSHAAVSSRPSVLNQAVGFNQQFLPNTDHSTSRKAANVSTSQAGGSSSIEPLLPTVLPAALQVHHPSPAISVMPPTGSDLSASVSQISFSESSMYASHDFQDRSAAMPHEVENQPEGEEAGGALPLLSVLGIRDDEENQCPNPSEANSRENNRDNHHTGSPNDGNLPLFVNPS